MAKDSIRGGSGPKWAKSDGKQGLTKGGDYGAKRMFDEAASPASVKGAVGGNFSKYKHDQQ